eukprot:13758307-Ditylum_brightwellii.AAC.1
MVAYKRYEKLKRQNGLKVLLDQMINETVAGEGEVEVDLGGLETNAVRPSGLSRSMEGARKRTRRILASTASGKKGSTMMGEDGKKGPGKKGLKGCNICPEWSPAIQMEKAKKAKKDSAKKGDESASPGGSLHKRRLNDDKDENGCCCDGGTGGGKKMGKKGDAATPELKVELNLTTTYVNDKYMHQTPNLSYTYN